jgi:TRAP-type C4-dicarboxylate transport system permease small subunit
MRLWLKRIVAIVVAILALLATLIALTYTNFGPHGEPNWHDPSETLGMIALWIFIAILLIGSYKFLRFALQGGEAAVRLENSDGEKSR